MSDKCGKCAVEFFLNDVIAKCVECKLSYHPACTRLGAVQTFTKTKGKTWKCDVCKGDTASTHSNEDTTDEKKTIMEVLKVMKADIISSIDSKVGSVRGSIDALTEELKISNNKIRAVEEEQSRLSERCDKLEQDNVELGGVVRELRLQLQDTEQHSRCANIEIQGLPLTPNESIPEILVHVSRALHIPFKKEDVSAAHRLRVFSKKHAHPPIIVQFVSRAVKEGWLTAARTKKGLNAKEIVNSFMHAPVYINDHLTGFNKALLGRARRLVREKKLYFAGYFNGKVLVKKRDGDTATRVLCMEDMDKFD